MFQEEFKKRACLDCEPRPVPVRGAFEVTVPQMYTMTPFILRFFVIAHSVLLRSCESTSVIHPKLRMRRLSWLVRDSEAFEVPHQTANTRHLFHSGRGEANGILFSQ